MLLVGVEVRVGPVVTPDAVVAAHEVVGLALLTRPEELGHLLDPAGHLGEVEVVFFDRPHTEMIN